MRVFIIILVIVSHLSMSKPAEYIRVGSGPLSSKKDDRNEEFDFDEYARRISTHESGGDPAAVSKSGLYIGLYQIGDLALKEIGWKGVTVRQFRKNPNIFTQEDQMKALAMITDKNRWYLKRYIALYSGREVHGYKITTAGLLAAAHHIGARKVKEFLKTGKISKDGNGVKMTFFIRRMHDL